MTKYYFKMSDHINSDIQKLIVDSYYTPTITDFVRDNRFYVKVEYPSNKIKLKFPLDYDYIRYRYKYTEKFIDKLNMNSYWSQLQLASNFRIDLCEHNIKIAHKKVEIKIQNTETIRDKLVDVLYSYSNYLVDNFSDDVNV